MLTPIHFLQESVAVGGGAGGAEGHAEPAPSVKKPAVGATGAGSDHPSKVTSLETSKGFWRQQIEKKTVDDDTVGAAEAEMKFHDADMQLHDAKAEIARANGDEEGAKKAEMAKADAKMAKAKAEMTKAKAEMTKAKAAGDIQGEELAGKEYNRAEAEYEAAKKVRDSLLEQVTRGGKGM